MEMEKNGSKIPNPLSFSKAMISWIESASSLLTLASAKLSQFDSMGGANFVVNHSPGQPSRGRVLDS